MEKIGNNAYILFVLFSFTLTFKDLLRTFDLRFEHKVSVPNTLCVKKQLYAVKSLISDTVVTGQNCDFLGSSRSILIQFITCVIL